MAYAFSFRDMQTLELAIAKILPDLYARAAIQVWNAGGADELESYTLAILLRETMPARLYHKLHIHADRPGEKHVKAAVSGVFARQEIHAFLPESFEKYFQPGCTPDRVRVVKELRDHVSFYRHDLSSLQPLREDCSLVVCKSTLSHFTQSDHMAVFRMFHRALLPDGILVMEHLDELFVPSNTFFRRIASDPRVYRRETSSPVGNSRENRTVCRHDSAHANIFETELSSIRTKPSEAALTSGSGNS